MNIGKCYMIREDKNSNLRKLLIEVKQEKPTSLGTLFLEITLRKNAKNTYDYISSDIVTHPFEYFQELVEKQNIKKVYPQSFNKIFVEKNIYNLFRQFNITNWNELAEKQEFNYNRNSDFFKLNGIDINDSKHMKVYNKRDK